MASTSLTGADTIIIDGRVLHDLADGDCVALTFPNDIMKVKASKNGNTLYALDETGRLVECSIRVLIGSDDDKFLSSRVAEMRADPANFILLTGSFTKRAGDGQGGVASTVYQCSGGVFKKQLDAKSNADGEVDQSVAVYTVTFGNGDRSIQ